MCSMLYVTHCYMLTQVAIRNPPIYYVLYAICYTLYAMYSMKYALHYMQCAPVRRKACRHSTNANTNTSHTACPHIIEAAIGGPQYVVCCRTQGRQLCCQCCTTHTAYPYNIDVLIVNAQYYRWYQSNQFNQPNTPTRR